MPILTASRIKELQSQTSNIRNICIVAHVDHGKTTLADNLVASNGIISQKLAGQLRYMDSRKDEQERGITMKSSSICLLHTKDEKEYLINLVDTPGHVDFTSEVSTAVRICDGAIVVVDVIEGVAAQTKAVLKQAWNEGIKPVLVVNKLDRLILELKVDPLDAYKRIWRVIEQVNAVMGELFSSEIMEEAELKRHSENDIDDSELYFYPPHQNVIFASSYDGWGFTLADFADLYTAKLGVPRETLLEALWGDFYYSPKTKSIMNDASRTGKKPLFVQLILENIFSIYNAFMTKDKLAIDKIIATMKVPMKAHELTRSEPKALLQSFLSKWIPVGQSLLDIVCNQLPSPASLSEKRVEKLLSKFDKPFNSLPEETRALKPFFLRCLTSRDVPVIVFISKMIAIPGQYVTRTTREVLTTTEIERRRKEAKEKYIEKLEKLKLGQDPTARDVYQNGTALSEEQPLRETQEMTIAVGRIFSGSVKEGDELYILGPKYNPEAALKNQDQNNIDSDDMFSQKVMHKSNIGKVYVIMGREIESIGEAYAGNIIGIGGLQDLVIKSATLTDNLACPAFTELLGSGTPILQTAIQPERLADMTKFVKGLKLLHQADPCARVLIDESGEYILATAGEIHLQKCICDLEEHYAGVKVSCSDPIVPFRETVFCDDTRKGAYSKPEFLVEATSPGGTSTFKIRAVPLPSSVVAILESHSETLKLASDVVNKRVLKDIGEISDMGVIEEKAQSDLELLKEKLELAFKESGIAFWDNAVDQIWSFGPRHCGPNILLNRTQTYKNPSFWKDDSVCEGDSIYKRFDYSFVNGFQHATSAGPLCEEPLHGVCLVVEEWTINTDPDVDSGYGSLSGQIMTMVKEGCRKALQARSPRLVLPMYQCDILASADVLGRVYAVLGRRHGRVLLEDIQEGSTTFLVRSTIPVVESFNFASEIRTEASGLAVPQLLFSHWEMLDIDPFWDPLEGINEEEDDVEFTINRAQAYINAVRRRKGLPVRERIIEHAEKQRTLSKNK